MANSADPNPHDRRLLFITAAMAAVAAIAVAALLVNIVEHKQEARNPFFRVVELNDTIDDPAIWGKDFPMQYDLYMRTVDMRAHPVRRQRGHAALAHRGRSARGRRAVEAGGGSAAERHVGRLSRSPRTIREKRGHAYMLDDQTYTERQQASHSRAPASTATPPCTPPITSSATATWSRASRR